ncbi:MAG: hypothetical protein QOG62_1907 [Thermoleophilaceae bacterium]|jgi:hypothetical protein|nr:hypothetical protein [Thermoleophilaceae bacterium]MEA2623100.1 hypothetical protein [Chloroflexota bacterium]
MPKIRSRIVAGLALGALLLVLVPAAGASATQPALGYYKWGWVTVRQTALGTYTPAALDRGNSAGRPNVVKQPSTGIYTVVLKGIGDDGGVPHVTAMGAGHAVCLIKGWGRGAVTANLEVYVICYNFSGSRVSTRFSLSYISTPSDPGPLAYLWADGTGDDDAAAQYSYNSSGGTNHIQQTAMGTYVVTLPGLGSASGNVEVSAFNGSATTAGTSPAGTNPATCNVVNWQASGGDLEANVKCREENGLLVDSGFTLSFTDHQGLKGHGAAKVAYLWASLPAKASYVPDSSYRYAKPAGVASITRQGAGRYTVTLPSMPAGGAVKVTAYGANARTCQLGSIRTGGTPQRVQVRCFRFDGVPANSKFVLSYLR